MGATHPTIFDVYGSIVAPVQFAATFARVPAFRQFFFDDLPTIAAYLAGILGVNFDNLCEPGAFCLVLAHGYELTPPSVQYRFIEAGFSTGNFRWQ